MYLSPVRLPPQAERRRNQRPDEIRRRPTRPQARALEVLAHALEYLVDTTLDSEQPASSATLEAVELLAARSRAIFGECTQILRAPGPIRRFLSRFL